MLEGRLTVLFPNFSCSGRVWCGMEMLNTQRILSVHHDKLYLALQLAKRDNTAAVMNK